MKNKDKQQENPRQINKRERKNHRKKQYPMGQFSEYITYYLPLTTYHLPLTK